MSCEPSRYVIVAVPSAAILMLLSAVAVPSSPCLTLSINLLWELSGIELLIVSLFFSQILFFKSVFSAVVKLVASTTPVRSGTEGSNNSLSLYNTGISTVVTLKCVTNEAACPTLTPAPKSSVSLLFFSVGSAILYFALIVAVGSVAFCQSEYIVFVLSLKDL